MIINSLDQLNKVSKKIIGKISNEDCILLYGEIGVGKTTSTRSIINNIQRKYLLDELFDWYLYPCINEIDLISIVKDLEIMSYD